MAKKEKSNYLFVTIVIIVFLLAAGALALFEYRAQTTGQAAAGPMKNINSVQIEIPQGTKQERCLQDSYSLQGQDQLDYLQACMLYKDKFCFSSTDCGPWLCIKNKCHP